MRVAVIGANLLGSATAFYVRRALDANRAGLAAAASTDATESSDSNEISTSKPNASPRQSDADEIVVFERLGRAGGGKYVTLELDDVAVPVGTASGMDVAASPALITLLKDAKLDMPPPRPVREWAIFDWDKDEYMLGQMHSRLCGAVIRSVALSFLIQLFALLSAAFFARLIMEKGFLMAFVRAERHRNGYVRVLFIIWFAFTALLGGGVIPIRWVMRVYDWIFFRSAINVTAGMTYGGHSMSVLGQLVAQIREHLEIVLERDAASSCVTIGHLLSACGMGKYAKVSVPEFVGKFQVQQSALDDCVSPGLAQTYCHSACNAGINTNALAMLFNMLVRCPVPASFRACGRYFDAEQTKNLCPQLLKVADAQLRLGVDIRSVTKASKTQYELTGTNASTGEKIGLLGKFDAVILAAVIDPSRFTTDATDDPLDQVLALDPALSGMPAGEVSILNTARYVSLVKGELNPKFFKKSDASSVATHVTVLNSVNCSEVLRVSDEVYRVSSGEMPEEGTSSFTTVFKDASKMISFERTRRPYYPAPIRNINGAGSPGFVLGTRFLNAACIDRVANDPSLDVLSARNAGSLFRDGVATWK